MIQLNDLLKYKQEMKSLTKEEFEKRILNASDLNKLAKETIDIKIQNMLECISDKNLNHHIIDSANKGEWYCSVKSEIAIPAPIAKIFFNECLKKIKLLEEQKYLILITDSGNGVVSTFNIYVYWGEKSYFDAFSKYEVTSQNIILSDRVLYKSKVIKEDF